MTESFDENREDAYLSPMPASAFDRIYGECEDVIKSMLENGQKITVRGVASRVKGDQATIASAVRTIRAELGLIHNKDSAPGLPPALVKQLSSIYEQMTINAGIEAEEAALAYEEKIRTLEALISAMRNEIGSFKIDRQLIESQLAKSEKDNDELKKYIHDQDIKISVATEKCRSLERELENSQDVIALLKHQNQNSHAQAEHLAEQARERIAGLQAEKEDIENRLHHLNLAHDKERNELLITNSDLKGRLAAAMLSIQEHEATKADLRLHTQSLQSLIEKAIADKQSQITNNETAFLKQWEITSNAIIEKIASLEKSNMQLISITSNLSKAGS